MAAPTQILPPWLSATEVIVNGQTETSLVFEPLTYFGPSIPLGTLFTFGGSTSPASQSSTTATPTSSLATSTAIPSSTSLSSSSITPSTSSSSSTTSSTTTSTTSSSTSESSTPSASATATTQSHGLERGQLIGVIIASILGFIFLFVLALFLYLWWNARRNRRRSGTARFSAVPPSDDDDLVIIPPGGVSPGEGSPRVSGDEADSLIRRQSGAPGMQQSSAVAGPSTRQPPSADNSISTSSKSTNSAASGYGTLLQNPSLGVFVPQFDDKHRNIISPDELRKYGDVPPHPQHRSRLSTVGEQGELVPLTAPPRLVDVPRSQSRLSAIDRAPSLASQNSDAGEATLLTARRVRAEDLGPRSTQLSPAAESSRRRESGAWKGMGLGGLAALGRMSWFQNITGSTSSRRNSRLSGQDLSDRDIEAGRALLNADPGSPPEMSELQGPRFRGQLGLGVGFAGDRPISGISANSRPSTIYHDAQSSLPGTPQVMPPPRAMANSSSAEFGYWPRTAVERLDTASSTTAAQGRSQDGLTGTQSTSASTGNPPTIDVLDMPAPRGISPFASSQSVREVGTSSSQGSEAKVEFPYPPGLTSFATPGVWNETTGTTPSPGSFAVTPALAVESADISIDVLEEEPPSPGNSWRTLASGNLSPGGARRTTFGMPQVVNPPDLYSEQGSLHSMRSHLSPVNSHSSGSAPASRRDKSGSTGSVSSRPSAHSAARSVISGSEGSGASLAHSGSISSDDRRKGRPHPPMSPAISAFGHTSPPPVSSPGNSNKHSSLDSSPADEPLNVSIPTPIAEVPLVGSSVEDQRQTSPRSPRSPLSSVPWAGGLDDAWAPS
ncbi:hypothetical protein F5880DRAFT_1724170 [Lentinula raphanica]|nr:hypothetical protein F5880DRAFT_1724170 [Lentinula raphanica]